ncbi:MAG TPA: TonB-dependent receptor [Steroidobacteraceae bacterium]|nr:TonB-dependent receptor [Steroidobacteraceae bacterium]
MKHKNLLVLWSIVLVPCAGMAGTPINYDAAYYAPFAPHNALDMVKQTPGFVLETAEDDEQRRGFSGAVGNVLVDGQRLSAKSQTPSDVLARIPAAEVVRIEILRGSDAAGDASGAAVLANVVRTRSAGGGWWAAGFELAGQDEAAPNGNFGWSGRGGLTEYSLGGSTYSLARELPGTREVYDGNGILTKRRYDESPREFSEYALNGEMKRAIGDGRLVLTGQVAYSRYQDDSTLLTTSPTGEQLEYEHTPYAESERTGEAGVTYERAYDLWNMNLAALATRKRYASDVTSTHFDAAGVQDSVFAQVLARNSGESILRATFARPWSRGRLETGAELALNTLDAEMDLSMDTGNGPLAIPVPNADVLVEEKRGEAFVNLSMTLPANWSLDARLAVESSHLAFSGDAQQSVSLTYVKPRLQVSRPFGSHQLQLRAYRDVSQLDFTDFVSAASLSDDVINGGNPDLRPQTAWVAELGVDLRMAGDAALRTRVFHQWLDDVVDLIPQGPPAARIDAPGNIGSGTLDGIEVSLQLPLGRVLPGGKFSLSGIWQDSSVRDPVTLVERPISGLVERKGKAELRQDLPAAKLSWGVSFAAESATFTHRLKELDTQQKSSSLDVFVETALIPRFTVRLSMLSILDDAETRTRRFYTPDRAGSLSGFEDGQRRPGHWWLLSVTGSL